jgi:hypothetical protein
MKKEIKKAIIDLFDKTCDFSVAEIISELEAKGFSVSGDRTLYANKNLIIWENTNSDFNDAVSELYEEGKIIMQTLSPTNALVVYAYAGEVLKLPIAEKSKIYSGPHWLPIILKRK